MMVGCTSEVLPGSYAVFNCGVTQPVQSMTCSFDGGPAENCTFPLVLRFERFGSTSHTVLVTGVDGNGFPFNFTFDFEIPPRKRSLMLILLCMYSLMSNCS